jgi:hypothetical protein
MDIWRVSNSEMRIFAQGQGNQADARRLTRVRLTTLRQRIIKGKKSSAILCLLFLLKAEC